MRFSDTDYVRKICGLVGIFCLVAFALATCWYPISTADGTGFWFEAEMISFVGFLMLTAYVCGTLLLDRNSEIHSFAGVLLYWLWKTLEHGHSLSTIACTFPTMPPRVLQGVESLFMLLLFICIADVLLPSIKPLKRLDA